MNAQVTIALTPELATRAGNYLHQTLLQTQGVEAVALCALNGKVIWASSRAFEKIAPSIGRIGIASLRLWAKVRTGRVQRVGLMLADGAMVEIIFVPPLASLLVVSQRPGHDGWPNNEPHQMIQSLGL